MSRRQLFNLAVLYPPNEDALVWRTVLLGVALMTFFGVVRFCSPYTISFVRMVW
jgi:hypothetical protein